MTASSYLGDKIPAYGRLFHHAWCAGNNNKSDWLQVDLGKEFYVGAVVTQGGSHHNSSTTDFKLLYSGDEQTWKTYQNRNGGEVVI